MKEIKLKVQTLMDNWYHGVEFDVIQVWERHWEKRDHISGHPKTIKLDFVRLFPNYRIKGEYHISVDNTVSV